MIQKIILLIIMHRFCNKIKTVKNKYTIKRILGLRTKYCGLSIFDNKHVKAIYNFTFHSQDVKIKMHIIIYNIFYSLKKIHRNQRSVNFQSKKIALCFHRFENFFSFGTF